MTSTSRRLVIHIGPHKTASSYIQVNLQRARDDLASKGWLYPSEATDGMGAHHHLAHNADQYLPDTAPYRPLLEKLGQSARANGDNIVLSAEGFCRMAPANFDVLADILGFDGYELVYVVRDQLDLFPSLWAEEVKQGRSLGLADRFAQEIADPFNSRIFNPMCDLNLLLARPRARVRVVPFDSLRRREIDIFEHMTGDILELRDFSAHHVKPVNVKFPIELTEFLRLMTLIHGQGQPNIGSDLRLRFTNRVALEEQLEKRKLLLDNAAHARRVIRVPGDSFLWTRIEQNLKVSLKDHWSIELGEDEPLFSSELRRFVYYDSYLLSMTPIVRQAAEAMVERLTNTESLFQ